MTEGKPRVISVTPIHPNGQRRETQVTNPSHVRILVDTGLKSGKLTDLRLDLEEAVEMTADLARATQQAFRAQAGIAQ